MVKHLHPTSGYVGSIPVPDSNLLLMQTLEGSGDECLSPHMEESSFGLAQYWALGALKCMEGTVCGSSSQV